MKKLIIILLMIPFLCFAWDDCPRGEVDCNGNIDANKDEYFQLALNTALPKQESEITGKDLKTKTVGEIAETYKINSEFYASKLSEYYGVKINIDDEFSFLHDNYGVEPSIAKDMALNFDKDFIPTKKKEMIYPMQIIVFPLVFLYLLGLYLVKKNKLNLASHRKFWNILLLITFLVSGIMGLLLVYRINTGNIIQLPFNILYWHVEFGIAMAIISIFHISWHLNYYRK